VNQKKRRINEPLRKLLVSGVSMRRSALLLGVRQSTVASRLRFLANLERFRHHEFLSSFQIRPLLEIQFDEMETFEHSKCKPLSIPIVVDPNTRKILNFGVASMPAKGPLAELARKKYGFRIDQRPETIDGILRVMKPLTREKVVIHSDQNPHYPGHVSRIFPGAAHQISKGRRGCVVGQGELKRGGYDPLFSLNHTCAMVRANVNRMFRRTWCTTKKPENLAHHLMLYVAHHNRVLTAC
jgi:hypothetical protein